MSDPKRERPGIGGVRIATVLGIPIFFSASWLFIAAYITYAYGPVVEAETTRELGNSQYLFAFGFAVLLALSVLVHEVSHCVVSQGLGLRVRRVTVFLLGGVSEIEQEPQTAGREYLVAVAGPLVSLLLSGIGFGLLPLFGQGTVAYVLCAELALANGLVAVFNLLPGLPLDGGRVLRAAVWRFSGDKLTGTAGAAYAGRGLAVVVVAIPLILAVLTGQAAVIGSVLFSVLLAGFIWLGATSALRSVQLQRRLPEVTIPRLVRKALPVSGELPLAEALRRGAETGAPALVVVDTDGRPTAIVAEASVEATPEHRRPWINVATVSRGIEPGLMLPDTLVGSALVEAVQRHPASEYLVVDRAGKLTGVLATRDLAAALKAGPGVPVVPAG